jgi:hypothetical protein
MAEPFSTLSEKRLLSRILDMDSKAQDLDFREYSAGRTQYHHYTICCVLKNRDRIAFRHLKLLEAQSASHTEDRPRNPLSILRTCRFRSMRLVHNRANEILDNLYA